MGIEYYLLSKNEDTCIYLHKIDRMFNDDNIEDVSMEELRCAYHWSRKLVKGLLDNPRTFFQLLNSNDLEERNDYGYFIQDLIKDQR